MKKSKKLTLIGLGALSLFTVCFCLSMLMYCLFIYEKPTKTVTYKREKSKDYRYLHINPSEEISNNGFVTLDKVLEVDEFVSYHDVDGNHFLISNFASNEYICTGSCICNENLDSRRNAGVLVQRGFVYLVAALTSFVAFEKAKELFDKNCRKELSETCSPTSVSSEVEHCEETKIEETAIEELVQHEAQREVAERKHQTDVRRYWCHGDCLVNGELKYVEYKTMADKFDCGAKVDEGEFTVDCLGLSVTECRRKARGNFLRNELDVYCRETSEKGVKYKTTEGFVKWREVQFCRGFEGHPTDPKNPTTICIQARKGERYRTVELGKSADEKQSIHPVYRPWGTE